MEGRRTVTIGVTINLGNYENLHLEVSDTAETLAEAAALRRFLADVLGDFAQNNATAKDAVDRYKERILDDAPGYADETVSEEYAGYAPETEKETEQEPKTENAAVEEPVSFMFADAGQKPETVSESEPEYAPAAESEPEPESKPQSAAPPVSEPPVFVPAPAIAPAEIKPPEPEPEPEPEVPAGEFTCERCGDPVSKIQHDVSRMFTGKTLCKRCFNSTR